MIDENHNPWKTNSRKLIHENPWIKIVEDQVTNPGGEDCSYTTVHFKNRALGVLPLDEDYNTWIVGQYRYPLKKYSWEIPEGGVPYDENLIEGGIRELKEETGINAKEWIHIMDFHTSNSITDEIAHIYVAKILSFGEANPDSNEELYCKKIPFQELFDMVIEGKIMDSLTIAAVFKTEYLIRTGNL